MANTDVQTFYNSTMPEKFGDDYEHARWFKNAIQKAGYDLTKLAIERHVLSDSKFSPKNILELGPGAGTWTKILVGHFADAQFDLVDISREMLERSKKALAEKEHITYTESDILKWEPKHSYELFFSSRVLEYIDDKKKFTQKIFSILGAGGRGFVITKMPHYAREQALGKTTSELHSGQIEPEALAQLFRSSGFVDVAVYPVTTSIPLLRSASFNCMVGSLLGKYPINTVSAFFAESYCVTFKKV